MHKPNMCKKCQIIWNKAVLQLSKIWKPSVMPSVLCSSHVNTFWMLNLTKGDFIWQFFPRFISKFEPSGLLADRGHISVETCTHRIGGCEATTIWGCYAMLSCRVHWLRSSDEPLRLGAGPSEQAQCVS